MQFNWNGKKVSLTFTQRNPKTTKEQAVNAVKSHFSQGESHGDNVLSRWNGKEIQVSDSKPWTKESWVRVDVSE